MPVTVNHTPAPAVPFANLQPGVTYQVVGTANVFVHITTDPVNLIKINTSNFVTIEPRTDFSSNTFRQIGPGESLSVVFTG